MNYGSYFRLNQSISRLENGVAVYDYIDLPAYFTSSEENLMSPKYPISVIITSSSVCFRLHYSSLKIEELDNLQNNDNNYPKYIYNIEDVDNADANFVKHGDNIKIAHMEEVILELPYVNDGSDKLSSTIKQIYNSQFPLADTRNENGKNSGGRFLKQKINYRYSSKHKPEGVEGDLYETMQKTTDQMPSYSSLWLMGLLKGEDGKKFYDLFDDGGNIVGFLRKILLDFMFDLKHSDVFQNSACYQQMYSGLMSDFFFSAMMHKCEYYYYRKLTRQAIDAIEKEEVDKENKKNAITTLYAGELIKAEDLWIRDIMNPLAEKEFEHRYPGKLEYPREFVELSYFQKWPSWFAEPEEEMRRVCFTMKDDVGERHICNASTLIKYLGLSSYKEDRTIKKMIELRNDDRELISRWFLRNYAFSDVMHLHWFKHANLFLILFVAIPLLLSWFSRSKLTDDYFTYLCWELKSIIGLTVIFVVAPWTIKVFWPWLKREFKWMYRFRMWKMSRIIVCFRQKKRQKVKNETSNNSKRLFCLSKIWGDRSAIEKTRIINVSEKLFLAILIISTLGIIISKEYKYDRLPSIPIWMPFVLMSIAFVSYMLINKLWVGDGFRMITSGLHLFLPRLVASITLSWITLSMGFDLYVSYFDAPPRVSYIIGIGLVLTFFVIYSINLVIPHSPSIRKIIRSLELIVISYFISLIVGFVIINFLGEKYLERGGYIDVFYSQHVEKDTIWKNKIDQHVKDNESVKDTSLLNIISKLENIEESVNDTNSHVRLVEKLQTIKKNDYKVAVIEKFWGKKFFILRDFLTMFAFIAMFMGIFIQLIIFGDNKQMTEL